MQPPPPPLKQPDTDIPGGLLFNLETIHDAKDDLWLRDGDVIEIPEK